VGKGELLAVLESSVRYEDMLELMQWINVVDSRPKRKTTLIRFPLLPSNLTIGPVQERYAEFQQRQSDYDALVADNYHEVRMSALQRQQAEYDRLARLLAAQKSVSEQEVSIFENELDRNRTLLQRKLIAESEFEKSVLELLRKSSESHSVEQQLAESKIRQAELEGTVAMLRQQRDERQHTLYLSLIEAYENLRSEVLNWEDTYTIKSPIDGRVTFFSMLQARHPVLSSEPILAVVPESGEIIGSVRLPQSSAAKVSVGHNVRVILDGYSENEAGFLRGAVEDVSLASKNDSYLAKISLSDRLTTTYGTEIPFLQEMKGSASIVTGDETLFFKIFGWLRSLSDSDQRSL
jgi:multidrug resistance efflux pump